jgi:hypothetical protein
LVPVKKPSGRYLLSKVKQAMHKERIYLLLFPGLHGDLKKPSYSKIDKTTTSLNSLASIPNLADHCCGTGTGKW